MTCAPWCADQKIARAPRSPSTAAAAHRRPVVYGAIARIGFWLLCIAALEYSQLLYHGNITSPRILAEALLTLDSSARETITLDAQLAAPV